MEPDLKWNNERDIEKVDETAKINYEFGVWVNLDIETP